MSKQLVDKDNPKSYWNCNPICSQGLVQQKDKPIVMGAVTDPVRRKLGQRFENQVAHHQSLTTTN